MKKAIHSEWEYLSDQTKNVYFQLGTFSPSMIKKLKQNELVKAAYESKLYGYDSSPAFQVLEYELSLRRERVTEVRSWIAISIAAIALVISTFFAK